MTPRLGLFLAPNISKRDILAWTFHHEDFSARAYFGTITFRHGYFLTPWHWNISAQGYFSTLTFQHRAPVRKCLCQNVHVSKHPCAKMFQCHDVPVPECPWYQNIPMPKCCRAKMSSCRKVPVMKCPCGNVSCRNVRCPNHTGTFYAQIVQIST